MPKRYSRPSKREQRTNAPRLDVNEGYEEQGSLQSGRCTHKHINVENNVYPNRITVKLIET